MSGRAHAEYRRERTPEARAAWEWERTTGCYIYQAKLAAQYSMVSAALVLAIHSFLESRKRLPDPPAAR
jgi:hypothetical protein